MSLGLKLNVLFYADLAEDRRKELNKFSIYFLFICVNLRHLREIHFSKFFVISPAVAASFWQSAILYY